MSDSGEREEHSLAWWVGIGALVTTSVGVLIFVVFAILLSGTYPWELGFTLRGLDGGDWFDAARTTVTLVGIIGLGGAAFLAYRKQRSNEESHVLELRARDLADAIDERDKVMVLRGRFTTCAEQLGSDAQPVRLAGVYALASLADDWSMQGVGSERQVCIDVLCAYLRTMRVSIPKVLPVDRAELDVRAAIIGILRNRTESHHGEPWADGNFDLNGAQLRKADLSGASLTISDLDGVDLTGAMLTEADLSDSGLMEATLVSAHLEEAKLRSANLAFADLRGANFTRADLESARAQVTSAGNACFVDANLRDANLSKSDLRDANMTGANLAGATMNLADLRGTCLRNADLDDASMRRIIWDEETVWPEGFIPPPSDVPDDPD